MDDLNNREKCAVISDYIEALSSLHDKKKIVSNPSDIEQVYFNKTIDRVNSVKSLIPNIEKDSITINGKKCKNIILEPEKLFKVVQELQQDSFYPIHGDPTFSNSLVDGNLKTWFIDPRGYFNKDGIYGDRLYDYAKLYYSAIGGYDAFNRRKFKLHIDEETVEILMEKPKYDEVTQKIMSEYLGDDMAKIEVIHGLIWLSLSGYVKDDIDSIIGSYYLGLYWLEQGIKKL